MSVHKNKVTGKWDAYSYYYDYTGKRKQKHKSGFEKKRDAHEWERQFDLKKDRNLDMSFGVFVEMYMANEEKRVKKSTFLTKQHIVEKKILPYFKDRKLKEITAADVIEWQNEMISFKNGKGKGHSQDYLCTIHAQLSAIFNHAVNLYGLSANPARQAGTMGKQFDKEMKFWTKEEFQRFIEAVANKPRSYYAFEMLYWCGIREGELLALTREDFDFEKKTVRINKTFQKLEGKDHIGTPKTQKSNRTIIMSDFLSEEMEMYIDSLYGYRPTDRIFQISKSFLHHEMDRGAKAAGVPAIRIHDLRHSHVSLLINMGYSALAIGERLGHESIKVTYRYAHLLPTVQTEMAKKLGAEREEILDVPKEER